MLLRFLTLISLMFVSSCSVNSNIGEFIADRAEREIRAGTVETYDRSELSIYQYSFVGYVENEICITDKYAPIISGDKFRRTLKSKAQQLGGNAIVYGDCKRTQDYFGCAQYMHCEGSAYLVEQQRAAF